MKKQKPKAMGQKKEEVWDATFVLRGGVHLELTITGTIRRRCLAALDKPDEPATINDFMVVDDADSGCRYLLNRRQLILFEFQRDVWYPAGTFPRNEWRLRNTFDPGDADASTDADDPVGEDGETDADDNLRVKLVDGREFDFPILGDRTGEDGQEMADLIHHLKVGSSDEWLHFSDFDGADVYLGTQDMVFVAMPQWAVNDEHEDTDIAEECRNGRRSH